MVGKIKHVRQKLHQEAVKLNCPSGDKQPPVVEVHKAQPLPVENKKEEDALKPTEQVRSSFPTGIFAGTKITPDALVQTLKLEQPPYILVPSKDAEEKKVKSKKEKMKERKEQWLHKISFIKQAQEQQAATARRRATPVVGDMRPLADALPELYQLRPPANTDTSVRRKFRKSTVPVRKTQVTQFTQMKPSQKRKLLETETSRFRDAVKTITLAEVGEQLRKRMRQEEEQDPS